MLTTEWGRIISVWYVIRTGFTGLERATDQNSLVFQEANYAKAEEQFMSAYKLDDRDFGFFTTLLYVMMRKFTASRMEEVGAMIDKKLYQPHWDRKQKGILHFVKGIALCAGGGSKSKAVADEFIKAYKFSEDSLILNVSNFQEF